MQRGGMGRGDGGEQWRGRTSRRSEGSARWRTSGDLGSGGEMGRFEERESFRGRGPKGFSRSDDRIREDVCDLLEDNPDLDASDVEVKVDSGEVTLTGRVDGRWAKRLAEDITCSVRGVRECHNQLRSSGMKESQQRGGQEMAAGANGGRRSEQFTAR
jgi:osmotically-inducible protein OsmY